MASRCVFSPIVRLCGREADIVVRTVRELQLAGTLDVSAAGYLDKARTKLWITNIDQTVTACLAKLKKKVNGIEYVLHDKHIPKETAPSLGPFVRFEFCEDQMSSLDYIEGELRDRRSRQSQPSTKLRYVILIPK